MLCGSKLISSKNEDIDFRAMVNITSQCDNKHRTKISARIRSMFAK